MLTSEAAARFGNPMKKPISKTRPGIERASAGEVRLIGGQWKRTRLLVPDLPGLRPTPDRVRETLFNWLGQDLRGWRCIDVFAGTGALGLEAASRGAAQVLLCEQVPVLLAQLHALQSRLGADAVQVRSGDGIGALGQLPPSSMDLVLLDPPFDSGQFELALRAAVQVVAYSGYVYLEAPRAWTEEELAGFGLTCYRYLKAGAVHAHLLRLSSARAA